MRLKPIRWRDAPEHLASILLAGARVRGFEWFVPLVKSQLAYALSRDNKLYVTDRADVALMLYKDEQWAC